MSSPDQPRIERAGANAPERLELDSPLDPYLIQPGSILFDRFCVVGRVRHDADGWRVIVSDVAQRAGASPHHRLVLHRLVTPDGLGLREHRSVGLAVAAHQLDARRVIAAATVDDGVVVVADPAEGPALRLPLTNPEAASVVRALASIVREAHRLNVGGLRFDLRDLRLDGGRVQFSSWRHLANAAPLDADTRAADVAALTATLAGVGTRRVAELIQDVTGLEPELVLSRLLARTDAAPTQGTATLPPEAPFVGRTAELEVLHSLLDLARSGRPGYAWISGPSGMGRSRLLRQAAIESTRDDRMVVTVAFRGGMPTTGLAMLLDAVAAQVHRLSAFEREQITGRFRRVVGNHLPLIRQASPALAELLGDAPRAVIDVPLQERFLRHAGALADLVATIGTPDRPLALYLDDVELADAGVRAVLWNLLTPSRVHHTVVAVSSQQAPASPAPDAPSDVAPLVLGVLRPRHLPLAPFTLEQTDRCLSAMFHDTDVHSVAWDLHRDVAGSPGKTWDLLRGWVEAGTLRARDGRLTVDPAAFDDEETDGVMSPQARAIGTCSAVRAEHVGPAWLAEVTGFASTEVRSGVGELVQRGFVVQQPNGALTWRDEGMRAVFLRAVSTTEFADAHARIAAWLDGADTVKTANQRAWHLEHASKPGLDANLAALHLEAGNSQLEHGDFQRAAWHFERMAERSADRDALHHARKGLASARLLEDQPNVALAAYLETIDVSPPIEALQIANEAITAFYLRGRIDAVLELADRALRRVGPGLPRGWVSAAAQVVGASSRWALRWAFGRPVTDPAADGVAYLLTQLVPAVIVTHPWVALTSLVRAPAEVALRRSGSAARARAFLAPVLSNLSGDLAFRWLDRAEKDAADDPANLPVVLHMRGQTELGFGRYVEGQQSLARAVEGFRYTGDLTIAVISLAMGAFAAIDREPTARLIERLEHARATAWRQRNRSILKNLRAMHLWVLVRAGRLRGAEIDREIDEMTPGDPLQDLVAEALIAMALLRDQRAAPALARIRVAVAQSETLAAKLPVVDHVSAWFVWILLEVGAHDEAALRYPALQKIARSNPSIRVVTRLLGARLAIHRGELSRARGELERIIAQAPVHGEAWNALTAHEWLAPIVAATNPAGVAAHRDLVAESWAQLNSDPLPPAIEAAPTDEPEDDLARLLDRLRATLGPALPAGVPLEVRSTPSLPLPEPVDVFELLVVNLVLAVRDGAPRAVALRLRADEDDVGPDHVLGGELAPGCYVRVGIDAIGAPLSTPRGAIRECRDLAAALGGALGSTAEGRLEVWLPMRDHARSADDVSAEPKATATATIATAAVMCSDERVSRTLITELVRLGWAAVEVGGDDSVPRDVKVVLADESAAVDLAGPVRVIRVRPRAAGPGENVLRFPFVVRELEGLLTAALSPTGATPPRS